MECKWSSVVTMHKHARLASSVSKWQQFEFGDRNTLEGTPMARLLSLILSHFSALMETDGKADIHEHHTALELCTTSWPWLPLVALRRACKGVRMAWMGFDVFTFLFCLLRCNLHIIQFTISKCTIQWFVVYSEVCATVTSI